MSLGTTAIIGAASGLGRLWAQRLQHAGHPLVLADRDANSLAALAGPNQRIQSCDITVEDDVVALFDAIEGPLAQVVLTAAIMPTQLVLDDDPARIRQVMETNYFGALNVLRAAVPRMMAQGYGEVVVFGSVAGEVPTPHMSAYSASKAALAMYVEVLQMELELANSPVEVRLVLPPMTDTPLLEQARTTSNPRSFEVGLKQGIVAKPADVVDRAMRAVARGRRLIYPHKMARALHLARRFIPRLLAYAVMKSEQE